jgi:hypothetical protein
MSTLDDSSLITFKAISNFIQALGSEFGKRQRSLALYCRLISKTTLSHEKPIEKHIQSFRDFCIANREAIVDQDETKLQNHIIKYSKKVYVNMDNIFKLADNENKGVIWNHILTISAFVDPSSKAKEILKKNMETRRQNGESGAEEDFLTNIIDKVEAHVDPSANPMQAVAGIMQSGIFTELIGSMSGGLTDGSLDIGKLMGTVQTMVSSIGTMAGGGSEQSPELSQMSDMMTNLTGMMGNMGVEESETAIPKIEEIDDEESENDSKKED